MDIVTKEKSFGWQNSQHIVIKSFGTILSGLSTITHFILYGRSDQGQAKDKLQYLPSYLIPLMSSLDESITGRLQNSYGCATIRFFYCFCR